ncbi:MAG TPA: nitroreductase family protein [Bacteroidota bacterium]|nr:nitroreductase family protein [Bacteroidota bacterium]
MKKIPVAIIAIMIVVQSFGYARQSYLKTVQLPAPDTIGGKPLMQVMKERKTSRSFSDTALPQRVVSNLLWAAFGINRPDGHRTAPSAMNWQEIDIYVATKDGLYRYDPQPNQLGMLMSEDIRSKSGTQDFVADAPMTLVYVADNTKTKRASGEDQIRYMFADCGFIAENVYLYCASEGLACVVRGSVDRPSLAKAMNLSSNQRILLAQTVGYPK